jgi:hypothetical protein
VTSGPFIFTDYDSAEFYEISANPDFAYYPSELPPPSSSTTSDSTTPTDHEGEPISSVTLAAMAVSGVSGVIIVYVIIEIVRYKRIE